MTNKNLNKAQHLIHQKRFDEADKLLRNELRLHSDSADAHYLTGVSEFMQGRLRPAIEELNKAIELDPKHTDASICLSVIYNDIGKYDEAKAVFEGANQSVAHRSARITSAVDKKFAVKHLEIADLYFRYRRYDEAIDEYSKSIVLNPTNSDTIIKRSKA